MGVATEIFEHIFGAAERALAVDDPFVAEQWTDEGVKLLRVREMLQLAMEADFAFSKSVLQRRPELPSKELRQYFLGRRLEGSRWRLRRTRGAMGFEL